MITSNERKLCLSGWLMENSENEYKSPLKLQKFLLFYEAFSKVAEEPYDFGYLKGYKRGPVFSNVYGDYTKERQAFNDAAASAYKRRAGTVDPHRAKKCAFLVRVLSEKELSELTHKMNLWKSKEEQIMSGKPQVSLSDRDFNEEDTAMIMLLDRMFPDSLVENSEVIAFGDHYFVFRRDDIPKLTESHCDALSTLSECEDLANPVYVEIDDEGRLLID